MRLASLTVLIALLMMSSIGFKFDKKAPNSNCRFAKNYNVSDFQNKTRTEQFILDVIEWETKFIKEVGLDARTGLTFDGYRIDVNSGVLLEGGLHYWTASSKESIQVGILAKVLEGNQYAKLIYTTDEVFKIVELKVKSFENFHSRYPGYGGYFPWVYLNGSTIEPTWDFKDRIPALDNGQLFWAAIALSQIWQENYPNEQRQMRIRWDEITWKAMIKNCRKVFFNETTKKIRAVANIQSITKPPSSNRYWNNDVYYLDDPYEGQLYAWLITLFAKDQFTQQQINFIWKDKRNKLKSVDYNVHSLDNSPITVQKGWWFSAHQQWKNLFMPYYLSDTYLKIQQNNQKVRTWHSVDILISGMFASVTGPASSNLDNMDYYSDCGIQQISFNKVTHTHIVTPYSVFPVLLVNKEVGCAWLHNMISSPAGQTIYGALQGTSIDGMQVSPVLTWDTKITTVLALMNGTTTIVKRFLQKNNYIKDFVNRLESQYSLEFKEIKGTDLPFALPKVTIRKGRPDFTTCK